MSAWEENLVQNNRFTRLFMQQKILNLVLVYFFRTPLFKKVNISEKPKHFHRFYSLVELLLSVATCMIQTEQKLSRTHSLKPMMTLQRDKGQVFPLWLFSKLFKQCGTVGATRKSSHVHYNIKKDEVK